MITAKTAVATALCSVISSSEVRALNGCLIKVISYGKKIRLALVSNFHRLWRERATSYPEDTQPRLSNSACCVDNFGMLEKAFATQHPAQRHRRHCIHRVKLSLKKNSSTVLPAEPICFVIVYLQGPAVASWERQAVRSEL